MSTPTDQFANLSIEPGKDSMAPTQDVVNHRAAELRDILSSFVEKILPNEFQAPIFQNITGKRPAPLRLKNEDWTISGNLPGTLLQWGSYDEQAWSFLKGLQSPDARAMVFLEKLKDRFQTCLDEYDELEGSISSATLRDEIYRIAGNLQYLSEAVYEDRKRREHWEVSTLKVALYALESLCKRTQTVIPISTGDSARRPSRRGVSVNDVGLSLFAAVTKPSSSQTSRPFLLDALELFSGAALKACHDQLVSIAGQLQSNNAADAYLRRFESLQQRMREESTAPPDPPASSGGSDPSRALEADPRPGSKRPVHSTTDTTPKRGRTSGSK